MTHKLNNTQLRILRRIAFTGSIGLNWLVDEMWPTSKQRLKKSVTVAMHCSALVDAGYLSRGFGYRLSFHITESGRKAAKYGTQQDRPAALRMAK